MKRSKDAGAEWLLARGFKQHGEETWGIGNRPRFDPTVYLSDGIWIATYCGCEGRGATVRAAWRRLARGLAEARDHLAVSAAFAARKLE